jgi:UDP:flavonoid glycosyltransferase YjiC (YdhE family)
MISFSTMFEQRNADKLQRSLDALADFQVHVVATTAGIVAPSELTVPANAIVLDYAAHDPIMRRAALVVTHGGHGTAMRALRHGVPMILIPGLAGDQPFVAAAMQEFGVGLALPGDPALRRSGSPCRKSWRCRRSGKMPASDPQRSPASTARSTPPTRLKRC